MQNKRVMLKLSGEALAKPEGGYNEDKVRDIAKQLKPSFRGNRYSNLFGISLWGYGGSILKRQSK